MDAGVSSGIDFLGLSYDAGSAGAESLLSLCSLASSTETGARGGRGFNAPGDVRYMTSWRHWLKYSLLLALDFGSFDTPERLFQGFGSSVFLNPMPLDFPVVLARGPFPLIFDRLSPVQGSDDVDNIARGAVHTLINTTLASAAFLLISTRLPVLFLQVGNTRRGHDTWFPSTPSTADSLGPAASRQSGRRRPKAAKTDLSCRKANSSILTLLRRSTLRFSADLLWPSSRAILACDQVRDDLLQLALCSNCLARWRSGENRS